jgi:DNA-3-methyladenine glycosylase I
MTDDRRCPWAKGEEYIAYHDHEWGVPLHDEQRLFEMLILEGAQAGLSWATILRKRQNYREAFDGFDPERIARYRPAKIASLMKNEGLVRNHLKMAAAVENAKAFLKVREELGSFDAYIWQFVGGQPKRNTFRKMQDVPAKTDESDAMSRDLKRRGFKFVGSTICYAYMQAVGMVNDHLVECPRWTEIDRALSGRARRASAVVT